jgi:hypothetical protein
MTRTRLAAATATTMMLAGLAVVGISTPAHAASCTDTTTNALASTTARIGGQLTVTGTNWNHPDGGGSVLGVKIETVDPEYPMAQGTAFRRTTPIHANDTVWAVIEAEEDGSFSAVLPMPNGTSKGAQGTIEDFKPGTYGVRLLTGSLKEGDTVCSRKLTFKATAAPAIRVTKKPVITGKVVVGKKVKAAKVKFSVAGAKVTYRWYRGAKAVAGAKGGKATYKVAKADAGKKLSVRVTASKAGHTSVTARSKAVKVKKKK